MMPSRPPATGGSTAIDPGSLAMCPAIVESTGFSLIGAACAECTCSRAPEAALACDRTCWTLIACVLGSGCATADVDCIVQRCSEPLGGPNALVGAAAVAREVPIVECMAACTGGNPDEDGGAPSRVSCAPPRAEPASARVGESIALILDPAVRPGQFTLSVTPWGSVGSLQIADGEQRFLCKAPGTADIAVESDACDVNPAHVAVTCTEPDGGSCCPIDPLGENAAGRCSELGGSPPCMRGCDCLRNGGVYYTETDAQGCLGWVLRPTLESEEHLVCLDEDGNPAPDPRNAE
jgi:hypothetical protein